MLGREYGLRTETDRNSWSPLRPRLAHLFLLQRTAFHLRAVLLGFRSEGVRRARTVSLIFTLHALSVREMLRERKNPLLPRSGKTGH